MQFLQALLAVRHRTHFAREPQLTERHQRATERLAAQAGSHRQRQGQIGGGLGDLQPAHQIHIDVVIGKHHARMTAHHRQQHGQTIAVDTLRHPPRCGETRLIDQRLHFDE